MKDIILSSLLVVSLCSCTYSGQGQQVRAGASAMPHVMTELIAGRIPSNALTYQEALNAAGGIDLLTQSQWTSLLATTLVVTFDQNGIGHVDDISYVNPDRRSGLLVIPSPDDVVPITNDSARIQWECGVDDVWQPGLVMLHRTATPMPWMMRVKSAGGIVVKPSGSIRVKVLRFEDAAR